MGEALVLIGTAVGLFALVSLIRGRLWFVRSRKQAALVLVGSFAFFIAGGSLLPPVPQAESTPGPHDHPAQSAQELAPQPQPEPDDQDEQPSQQPQQEPEPPSQPSEERRPASLGVSRQDIQAWLAPAGFTFQTRADIYGQPHIQGTSDTGASISLIGQPDALTRIEITMMADDATDAANAEYVGMVFQRVLRDQAGPAMEWVGQQLSAMGSNSINPTRTFGGVVVDLGADPSGYVRIALYPDAE